MQQLRFKKTHPDGTIYLPQKLGDVGYDLIAVSNPTFENGYIQYDTGVAIELPEGYHAEIVPRSSICKYDLQLCNSIGIIDNGFRGSIILRFKVPLNIGGNLPILLANVHNGFTYMSLDTNLNLPKKGDRIAQLIIRKSEIMELVEVQELVSTDRGSGGFGSTGA